MAIKKEVEIDFRKADYWKIVSSMNMFQRGKTNVNICLFDNVEYRNKIEGNLRQYAVEIKNVVVEGVGHSLDELYTLVKADEFFVDSEDC